MAEKNEDNVRLALIEKELEGLVAFEKEIRGLIKYAIYFLFGSLISLIIWIATIVTEKAGIS